MAHKSGSRRKYTTFPADRYLFATNCARVSTGKVHFGEPVLPRTTAETSSFFNDDGETRADVSNTFRCCRFVRPGRKHAVSRRDNKTRLL